MPASNTENHSSLILEIRDRTSKLVAQSDLGSTSTNLKLEPGTTFKDGDLQVDFTDGAGNTSPLAPVPGFTVPGGSSSSSSSSSSDTVSGSAGGNSNPKSTK